MNDAGSTYSAYLKKTQKTNLDYTFRLLNEILKPVVLYSMVRSKDSERTELVQHSICRGASISGMSPSAVCSWYDLAVLLSEARNRGHFFLLRPLL
jgi:hypothetical protein